MKCRTCGGYYRNRARHVARAEHQMANPIDCRDPAHKSEIEVTVLWGGKVGYTFTNGRRILIKPGQATLHYAKPL